ncbi:MAG TPA: GNAT family N-acetyltransferase [Bacteroidales bacterium]|nr:GNAT family N-acetyltransferase [Bacteroidales bacterium]HNQ82597.1 GNAT family N-acetyltransferase [Bacteroidales bacterium]HOX76916.1 GNAT family N-acetyltransferase [Bacteroidales bacterium]HPI86372.1 GNAT family N-acetyltransferase [Bacteroidales bacterium]HPM92802.1 GNAT family N-acetyltransferase [Bacteroidales bacterium]
MEKIEFIRLDNAELPDWDEIPGLFNEMYARMDEMGLMVPLAADGAQKWLRSTRNTAGKFGIVVLARIGEVPVGFAHGMIKFLPDYLGNHSVGLITHVFVKDIARKKGLGRELVKMLEGWFHDKNVHSIELQVINDNLPAQKFWENLGYRVELTQYRKIRSK